MYARSPAHPRAMCAVQLQSLLFRHDFAFVVFYLSLLFMGQGDTISSSVQWQNFARHIDQLHLCHRSFKDQTILQLLQKEINEVHCTWYFEEVQEFRSVDIDRSGNILRPIYQWLLVTTDIPSAEIVYAAICLWIRAMNGHRRANTDSCKQDICSSPNYFYVQPI